jgi:formyl-CoA transferase
MWQLLGRDDLAEDPRYLGQDPDGDFYYNNVIPAIEEWSQTLSKWEVVQQLTEVGFSMGVAQTISDLDQCPQLAARQMFVETNDTLGGRFKSLKTPIHLNNCQDSAAGTPPLLGENNREILCGIGGLSPEQLAQLKEQGAV